MSKDNPRVLRAWEFYDWANSVHSLVIASAVFPVYYGSITLADSANPKKVMGLYAESAFNFSLAISFLVVILISPVLSSIADTAGNKKNFMRFFCYLGGLSCMGMFFFTEERIILGLGLNVLSGIGFWGSLVFYNSYLPEIATKNKMDSVSAKGFILGYIGSVLLLIFCLLLIYFAPNEKVNLYTRMCFVLTGLWWMGFAQYTFRNLPDSIGSKEKSKNIIKSSFRELKNTFKYLNSIYDLRKFLASFFFYSLGMQTIFLVAALYGKVEIHLNAEELIITILLVQLIAIPGAALFSFISKKLGNRNALLIGVFMWIVVCASAYLLDNSDGNAKNQFFFLAGLIGLVMGGIQALSRSTYAKLLPETKDTTTFFSFYDVFEKLALFIGLFISGLFIEVTGGMKTMILAMGVSFIISFIILFSIKK